jgi:hypothetical protein
MHLKDWINNSMIFRSENVDVYFREQLLNPNLTSKYKDIKLVPVKIRLARECFIHDPSGILVYYEF